MSTVDPGITPRYSPDPLPPRLPPAHPRKRSRWLVPLVAVATVIAGGTAAGVLWARSGGDLPAPAAPAPATSSSVPSSTTAPSAPVVPSPVPGAVRAVPVYYVADVDNSPRLYREFHRVPLLNDNPVRTAVTEMLRDNAADPDYLSMWPSTIRVLKASTSGDLATVDLSGFVAVGSSYELAAVQQLVYTVTAADPSVSRVRLLVNGTTPPSGHMDWSAPISRANALGLQANVWILEPTEGTRVTSPVTVSVYGTGFEGNVPLRVYRGEDVVASTFVTTMMGGFAQARTTISLPPGTYELRAYNDSGLDASLTLWDTKTFTVR